MTQSIFLWAYFFCAALTTVSAFAEITLVGASQHERDHIYGQIVRRFGERIQALYGEPLTIRYHHSDENPLGDEKNFAVLMHRGHLDFAIIAPSHAANVAPAGAFLDTPFLFWDINHWERAIQSGALDAIADKMRAQNLRVVGFAGGATRHIFSTPDTVIRTFKDLQDVRIRVMGSDIQRQTFRSFGMTPRPMPYDQIYGLLQQGALAAAENEATGIEEHAAVAPNVALTMHAITVRPICFSEQRFQALPEKLQQAILKAGQETAAWARATERAQDQQLLQTLVDQGRVNLHHFSEIERRALFELTAPIKAEYAKQLAVDPVLQAIDRLLLGP